MSCAVVSFSPGRPVMTRSILLCTVVTLVQSVNLIAQDGPVRSIFPHLPTSAPSQDSGIMNVFGPEIDVGLKAAEAREIMRVLASARGKKPTLRVIDDHWTIPGE